ncbi:MAG: glucose-1-phosphate thymidylyltransferase [Elusimicrobia bacterium CG1_02_56_21]|nr:MAG: glucose-1-phosphate thymidylyltransferase [Elusimicrobia bacterium CG1_02_56_21]
MKGIILAGGSGTRLYPVTTVVCKQLLPVYDKPMIYYPLSALMLAGIKDILLISTPQDLPRFREIFGDGTAWGLNLEYKEQPKPEGIAQAFLIAEDFVGKDDVCLVLGDNIFYGHGLPEAFQRAVKAAKQGQATVFGYYVNDPERYGVVAFNKAGKALSIEEKPEKPRSKYAVTGLYFYPNEVIKAAKNMKPSARGELEITDVNKVFLKRGRLKVELLGRGYAWLDTGTFDSLLEAGEFIATVERRQGLKIACIEEIAYNMGLINKGQLLRFADKLKKNSYGEYLKKVADGE